MKTRKPAFAFIIGLGLALGLLLQVGSVQALTLDVGTPILLVDGNSDGVVTIQSGASAAGYTFGYMAGSTFVALPLLESFTGGTVLDLALRNNTNPSLVYSLSGDALDNSYSLSMQFFGTIPAANSANPVLTYDYFNGVSVTWMLQGSTAYTANFAISGSNSDGVAPVPEPGTLLLLGSGLLGMAGTSRLRRWIKNS